MTLSDLDLLVQALVKPTLDKHIKLVDLEPVPL